MLWHPLLPVRRFLPFLLPNPVVRYGMQLDHRCTWYSLELSRLDSGPEKTTPQLEPKCQAPPPTIRQLQCELALAGYHQRRPQVAWVPACRQDTVLLRFAAFL